MRILLISGSLPPMKCGIGDYTALLAQALGNYTDFKIGILTNVSVQPISASPSLEILAVAQSWSLWELKSILTAIRRWKPDLIHFQFPTQGYGKQKLPWFLPLILAILRYPIVQTWHEYVIQNKGLADWKNSFLYLPNVLTPGGLIVVRPNYLRYLPSAYQLFVNHKYFRFIPNASAIPALKLSEDERQQMRNKVAFGKKFIVYFGFALPAKGVELLFEVLDPQQHYLILICDLNKSDPYHSSILERVNSVDWIAQSKVTGFLNAESVGRLLATAEAVVLPFRAGGGSWNTSLQAATQQGTFVLTTSNEFQGYDKENNIYYAQPDDVTEMQKAISNYAGHRLETKSATGWKRIAHEHLDVYQKVLPLQK